MGYSMGARVIMSCLFELVRVHREWEKAEERRMEGGRSPKSAKGRDREKEREREKERQDPDGRRGSPAAGLIHTVVVMGTPLPCDEKAWAALRTIVADRVVHCYSKRDWMLGLMYRYSSLSLKVDTSPSHHTCIYHICIYTHIYILLQQARLDARAHVPLLLPLAQGIARFITHTLYDHIIISINLVSEASPPALPIRACTCPPSQSLPCNEALGVLPIAH
jgi:hypothetical protein